MKQSPLQLVRYYVPDISCSANGDFDDSREAEYSPDQFTVTTELSTLDDSSEEIDAKSETSHSHWMIQLQISQQIGPKQNFPYEFNLTIIGIFCCSNHELKIPKETFVKVNGSSILYGVAREMIRATTARGPWQEIMVPTISFYEPPPSREADRKRDEKAEKS